MKPVNNFQLMVQLTSSSKLNAYPCCSKGTGTEPARIRSSNSKQVSAAGSSPYQACQRVKTSGSWTKLARCSTKISAKEIWITRACLQAMNPTFPFKTHWWCRTPVDRTSNSTAQWVITRYQPQMVKAQPPKAWTLISLSIKACSHKIRILRCTVALLLRNSPRAHQARISVKGLPRSVVTRSSRTWLSIRGIVTVMICTKYRRILMKTNQEIGCKAAMNCEHVQNYLNTAS